MAKILIVDDDNRCAQAVAQQLSNSGHRCAIRQRGSDVLDFLKNQHPDLIILDVMLPDYSGFQLCRAIRQDESLYRIPVLVLSAMNSPEEVEHGIEQGADDYVTKPFHMENLIMRVNGLLGATQGGTYTDPITALPNAQGVKRELQRRMRAPGGFGLIYIELTNLVRFTEVAGAEARDKALRHLARALTQCGQAFRASTFFVGHMGAGHFLCVVPEERAVSYCERIREIWDLHVNSLIDSTPGARKKAELLAGEGVQARLLELLFCITQRDPEEHMSAQDLIEIVSRIHSLRSERREGGIHFDRRVHSQV